MNPATYHVSESKELTLEDSMLLIRWKSVPPERLRSIILIGRLQRVLVLRGHTYPLSVDGQYGPHTDQAARAETDSEKGLRLGPELSAIVKARRTSPATWTCSACRASKAYSEPIQATAAMVAQVVDRDAEKAKAEWEDAKRDAENL